MNQPGIAGRLDRGGADGSQRLRRRVAAARQRRRLLHRLTAIAAARWNSTSARRGRFADADDSDHRQSLELQRFQRRHHRHVFVAETD